MNTKGNLYACVVICKNLLVNTGLSNYMYILSHFQSWEERFVEGRYKIIWGGSSMKLNNIKFQFAGFLLCNCKYIQPWPPMFQPSPHH